MKTMLVTLAVICLPSLLAAEGRGQKAEDKKPTFDIYNGYFQKNTSGLTGDSSYLVFTSRDAFDKVFGVARVIGRQKFLPKGAFKTKIVVAVIKRGKAVTRYTVEGVTANGETLAVRYRAKMQAPGPATFASPLILSVARDKYKSVEFIENGKKVKSATVGE